MYKIDRKSPWPPGTDLSSARNSIRKIERDMCRVPQFADIAAALRDALNAIDQIEAKCPTRLDDNIVTASRFTTTDVNR